MIGNIYPVPTKNYRLVVVGRGYENSYAMALVLDDPALMEEYDLLLPPGLVYPNECVCASGMTINCVPTFLRKRMKPCGNIADIRILGMIKTISIYSSRFFVTNAITGISHKRREIKEGMSSKLWD
jgi:hypothetical protein